MSVIDTHTCQLVSCIDIARRLGLQPNTVAQYNQRGLLPPPRWILGISFPVWCFEHDIEPVLINGRFSKRSA